MIILRSKLFAVQNNNQNPQQENSAKQQVQAANKNTSLPTTPSQAQPDKDNNQLTSKDLQIEQMRMQRQLLQTQRMKQRLQADERRERLRQISKLQREEAKKEETETKNQIKVKKIEMDNRADEAKNVGLYKRPTKMPEPVSMK